MGGPSVLPTENFKWKRPSRMGEERTLREERSSSLGWRSFFMARRKATRTAAPAGGCPCREKMARSRAWDHARRRHQGREDVTGLARDRRVGRAGRTWQGWRVAPQARPGPERPLPRAGCGCRPLVGRLQWVYAPKIPPASGVSRRTVFTRDVFHVES